MKFYALAFLCLLLIVGCKKKDSDPSPVVQPDKVIYTTGFNDGTWPTHTSNKFISQYDKEAFNLSIDTANWFGYEIAPNNFLNSPYSIEADVKITLDDDSQIGYAGFIYNYISSQSYSILNICTNGSFYAYKVVDGKGQQLAYTTVSHALLKGSGQINTIKIKQRRASQEFIFNGVSQGIFPFQIETQIVGVGLTATSSASFYTPVKATFDNFIIKEIH